MQLKVGQQQQQMTPFSKFHISRPSLESGDNCNTVDNDCEDKLDDNVDEEDCKVHQP